MYKWDTIEKQETYDEDWNGIKYTLSWDMRIKNAEFSFDENLQLNAISGAQNFTNFTFYYDLFA